MERQRYEVSIYDTSRSTSGTRITGPGIIDANDTTVFVPPGVTPARDAFLNYRLYATEE